MAEKRRTSTRGRSPGRSPGSQRRPGARVPRQRTAPEASGLSTPPTGRGRARTPLRSRRPRLTGRFGVLALVLVVLAVSYASSLRAYLDQRREIAGLHADIAASKVAVAELRREKKRWGDPAFVEAQARARFGFVEPGETGYQVIGTDGKPLDADQSLTDPHQAADALRPPWWQTAWGSVENAGHPPSDRPPPATLITPPPADQ